MNIFDSAFAAPLEVAAATMGEAVHIGGVVVTGVVEPVEARENDRPGPGKTALAAMVHLTAAAAATVPLERNTRVVLGGRLVDNVLVVDYVRDLGAQGVEVFLATAPSVGDIMGEE